MKKLFSYFVVVLGIVSIAIISSCEKYEVSTPYEINDSITATISGYVYADLNLQETGKEYAPTGTTIFIQVELQQYNPHAPNGEFKTYSTTVGSDGTYSFNLPSNDNGVNFTIIPESFRAEQLQWDDTYEDVVFNAATQNAGVVSSENYIYDIVYF